MSEFVLERLGSVQAEFGNGLWSAFSSALTTSTLHEGYLYKYNNKPTDSRMELRYFILQENYLIYKKTKESSTISSALQIYNACVRFPGLEDIQELPEPHHSAAYPIKICKAGKFSILHARNEEEYLQWMTQLSRVAFRNDFHSRFRFKNVLGQGTFAMVCEGELRQTPSMKFAVKGFQKLALVEDAKTQQAVFKEITILRQLDHPNLLRLHEVHETENSIYIVFNLLIRN